MVLGALMAYLLPATAQNAQEWQSTSTMRGTGSAYSSQVTEVGAVTVTGTATTTESYSPAKITGKRRSFGDNQDGGQTGDPNSPIGDALLPLMLMAAAFGGLIYLRRRKAA